MTAFLWISSSLSKCLPYLYLQLIFFNIFFLFFIYLFIFFLGVNNFHSVASSLKLILYFSDGACRIFTLAPELMASEEELKNFAEEVASSARPAAAELGGVDPSKLPDKLVFFFFFSFSNKVFLKMGSLKKIKNKIKN